MQNQVKLSHSRRRLRSDQHKSQPSLSIHTLSESTSKTDIPPNRLPPEQPKAPAHSPELECDETMDSYQVQLPIVDVEEDAFEEVTPARLGKGSGSFVQEIHEAEVTDEEAEAIEESSWKLRDKPYIYSLLEKETEYACNPFSLQLHQPNITPLMRAVLLDWMMEVCSEFTLKRETYYLSVSYVDRYLSACAGVKKEEFQLVGLSAMFVAAKAEEICNPKIADFARSADNGYSQTQIKSMELRLLRALAWRMFPPTVFNWLNLSMSLWDEFLSSYLSQLPAPPSNLEAELIHFKQSNQHSYKRYRETMQVLDVAYLDVGVLRYSPRHIVAGLLYLMVSKYFYESEYRLFEHITADRRSEDSEGHKNSLAVVFGDGNWALSPEEASEALALKHAQDVQELFGEFSRRALEVRNIEEIYPSVAFLHGCMELEVVVELPVVCKVMPKAKLESHYEDFLAFQTHNSSNVPFVSLRLKTERGR